MLRISLTVGPAFQHCTSAGTERHVATDVLWVIVTDRVLCMQALDQILMQLLPLFAKPRQDTVSPGYCAGVGLPKVEPQLMQPILLRHIQDKSLRVDPSYLTSHHPLQCHPEGHQQQQEVLVSCMQWFHETVRKAMSSNDELSYSIAVSSADMLPYIQLISRSSCSTMLCSQVSWAHTLSRLH